MITADHLRRLADSLNGVPVLGALPGSTSYEAGIRYGDIILQVNGQLTPTPADYLEAKKLREDGFDLVVFRDGSTFEVYVPFGPPMDLMDTLAKLSERYEAISAAPEEAN